MSKENAIIFILLAAVALVLAGFGVYKFSLQADISQSLKNSQQPFEEPTGSFSDIQAGDKPEPGEPLQPEQSEEPPNQSSPDGSDGTGQTEPAETEPTEQEEGKVITLEELADVFAENMLQAFSQKDYQQYSKDFNEEMKEATTEEVFLQMADVVEQKIGKYVSKQAQSAEKRGSYVTVYYKAKFTEESADAAVKLVLLKIGEVIYVAGFWLDSPNLRQ